MSRFAPLGVGIGRAKERPEVVASMRGIGQTQQGIADKLGVSLRTVEAQTAKLRVEGASGPPATVTNSRGQDRPATYKKKEKGDDVTAETVEDRRSLVELMAYDDNGGMSTRQIGKALGAAYATVQRDMKSSDTFVSDQPRKVQSSDDKTRTYTKSAPREKTADERGCSQASSSEISRLLP